MKPLTLRRMVLVCGGLLGVLLVVVLVSLKLGAVPISITDLVVSLWNYTLHGAPLPSEYGLFVFEIRLPRIVLGILVGASLAVAGAGFQALLRNPLADPYVLGVSSGAALGAILSLAVASRATIATPLAAFAGATATIAAVYMMGRRRGQIDSYTLLLAGIITASFLSAVIMFLMTTLTGRDLRGMAFWLMGDLSTPLPINPNWLFLIAGVAVALIYTTAGDLNLMLTGEQEAIHLGVDVARVKLVVYLCASLLTS